MLHPEVIKPNWNELGYLPPMELPLEEAMRGAAEEEGTVVDATSQLGQGMLQGGDVVLSRYDGFAAYLGDGNWVGSLNVMRPGQGYRLHAPRSPNVDGETVLGEFTWPSIGYFGPNFRAAAERGSGVHHDGDPWPMDVRNKQTTLSASSKSVLRASLVHRWMTASGLRIDAEGTELCVGQVRRWTLLRSDLLPDGVRRVERGGCVAFKPQWCDREELLADETMAFDGPALRGTLEDPIVFHFSRSGDAARAVNLLTAYPNPFDRVGGALDRGPSNRDAQNGGCSWQLVQLEEGRHLVPLARPGC